MGQQPCLWKDFNLKFVAALTDEDDQPLDSPDLEHLLQVLSLERFQSLQSLQVKAMIVGLGFSMYVDFANLLHIVRDKHPTIKKLSLELSTDGSEDEIAQLAEELVMFQEVDLAKCNFGSAGFKDSDAKDSTAAFLKALLSASAGPTSKLKILTICDLDKDLASIFGMKRTLPF